MNYFANKKERAEAAKKHTQYVAQMYKEKINECVENTIIYQDKEPTFAASSSEVVLPECFVDDLDSVSAIFKYGRFPKTAVLNFASYKTPGGLFFEGSSAQEESLCHESFLYNVLKEFDDTYYAKNRENRNKALYTNAALYSPNVIFERDGQITCCDVITCAAPNKTAAQKYLNVSDKENSEVLASRIRFVLQIAKEQGVNKLILGAFGCGVFGQNPKEVASLFYGILSYYFQNCFDVIVFAIPDKTSANYLAFEDMFSKKN